MATGKPNFRRPLFIAVHHVSTLPEQPLCRIRNGQNVQILK